MLYGRADNPAARRASMGNVEEACGFGKRRARWRDRPYAFEPLNPIGYGRLPTIASTIPAIVNSVASIAGSKPSSRNVPLVTGLMLASRAL